MSKLWLSLVLAAVLSACTSAAPYAPWPSGPADVQAKRFETVPDRAVIYVVRVLQDLGNVPATLWLDNQVMGATYMGTYFRWEVPAGQHLIAGYGSDNGMRYLVVLARAIDIVNSFVGRAAAWLVLAAVLVSAGNALVRYALGVSSNAWRRTNGFL